MKYQINYYFSYASKHKLIYNFEFDMNQDQVLNYLTFFYFYQVLMVIFQIFPF